MAIGHWALAPGFPAHLQRHVSISTQHTRRQTQWLQTDFELLLYWCACCSLPGLNFILPCWSSWAPLSCYTTSLLAQFLLTCTSYTTYYLLLLAVLCVWLRCPAPPCWLAMPFADCHTCRVSFCHPLPFLASTFSVWTPSLRPSAPALLVAAEVGGLSLPFYPHRGFWQSFMEPTSSIRLLLLSSSSRARTRGPVCALFML